MSTFNRYPVDEGRKIFRQMFDQGLERCSKRVYFRSKSDNDFDSCQWSEALFCTADGSYVLHGLGDCRSCYGIQISPLRWVEGVMIAEITFAEAVEWGMDNMLASEFKATFGGTLEDVMRQIKETSE